MKWHWIAGVSIIAATMATEVIAAGGTQPITDPEGKTFALVVSCDACKAGSERSAKPCEAGAEEGWLNGQTCGKCMLTANAQQPFDYAYDMHIMGKLVDGAGAPVKERFVKMFVPSGWSMRSRTTDDGMFHFMVGATAERKSQSPVVRDLGTYTDAAKGSPYYALFLLPESYQPCAAEPAKPAPKKSTKKKP